MSVGLSPLFACLVAAAGTAAGATVVDPFKESDESELFRAEQRVVTVASRYAQAVEEAPSIVTVVTDREIRSRGWRTLSDVLRAQPGVYVTVSKESRDLAWFRGVISGDNNKFLLLVDGVPWYDGAYTHAFIDEYLPLVNVKQVEIIKGPGSAIYGTNAFAGVVNVVTYKAEDLRGGFFRVEVGDGARTGLAAVAADMLSVRGSEVAVQAHARFLDMDGDGLDLTPRDRANVHGTDPRRAVNGGFAIQAGDLDLRLDLVDYRHTYFVNEQDDALDVLLQSPDEFNLSYSNQFLAARYDFSLGLLGRVTPHLYLQRYDNPGTYAWFDDPVSTVQDDGTVTTELSSTLVQAEKVSDRYGGGVELELHPSPVHTTVGGLGLDADHVVRLEDLYYVDFSHDADSTTFRADPTWIRDLFAFAQHTWTATWWFELTGGLRVDHHSYFGFFPSPRAGLLFVPSAAAAFKVLYGRAFRAPTARELLVQVGQDDDGSNLFTNGNPATLPEVIDTVEVEVSGRPARGLKLRGAGFLSDLSQEINKLSEPDPTLGDDYYGNQGGSSIAGVELQGNWTVGAFELEGSYSFVHAEDKDTGYLRYGFPPHMAHGSATWQVVDKLRLSALADLAGRRPREDWTPNSGLADGEPYLLVHLAAATGAFADGRLSADLSVRNVLDADYRELSYIEDADATTTDEKGRPVAKYPDDIEGEGRTIVIGLEYRF